MHRYLVERSFPPGVEIPASRDGAPGCREMVANNAEEEVTWLHSYVTPDGRTTFCLCDGPSPEAIRRAARRNHLPITRITEVLVLEPYPYHPR